MAEPEKKTEEGKESEKKEEVAPPPPQEPEKLGEFSVWAMPNHYDPTLHLAMTQLKETYEGPEFEPHVTVMGAYTALPSQAEKCLKELCASILPITLKIKKVGCGNTFHQCVYLLMDPTEEVPLHPHPLFLTWVLSKVGRHVFRKVEMR